MAPQGTHTPDEALVALYQKTGDKMAVGELFKRHSLMCYAVCNKYLKDEDAAKDATMSIFEKLFTDLQSHQVQNFKSWFHTVSRNYCLMQLRKPQHLQRMDEVYEENGDLLMEFGGLFHHTDGTEDKEQQLQALEKAMTDLNDKQRQCIDLFYIKQKSYTEISLETGYTANEVKSHIQNGKRNLKNALSQLGINLGIILLAWIQQSA